MPVTLPAASPQIWGWTREWGAEAREVPPHICIGVCAQLQPCAIVLLYAVCSLCTISAHGLSFSALSSHVEIQHDVGVLHACQWGVDGPVCWLAATTRAVALYSSPALATNASAADVSRLVRAAIQQKNCMSNAWMQVWLTNARQLHTPAPFGLSYWGHHRMEVPGMSDQAVIECSSLAGTILCSACMCTALPWVSHFRKVFVPGRFFRCFIQYING